MIKKNKQPSSPPYKGNRLTITEAVEEAKECGIEISKTTIVTWCKNHNIGFQPVPRGNWYIYADVFRRMIRG